MPDARTLQTVPLELSPHALVFEASGDVRLATDGSFLLGDVGSAVRLNGVFASFAESYWRRHTQVRTVDFALTLAGRVLLRIVRRDLVRGIEHCILHKSTRRQRRVRCVCQSILPSMARLCCGLNWYFRTLRA